MTTTGDGERIKAPYQPRVVCQIRAITMRQSVAGTGTMCQQKARSTRVYAAGQGHRAAFGTLRLGTSAWPL